MNKTWVFFYGTFMSARILREHGLVCDTTFPAKLSGYSLSIQPRVNLVKNPRATSYGGLALIEQEELVHLYDGVQKKYGHTYYPYPVLAEMSDGLLRLALCYVSEEFSCGNPESTYIDELVQCAREMNAPESYILHIESFRKQCIR